MLKRLPAYFLLLGLACQFGHAQRSGGTFSILSESIGPLVAEGNTSTSGFSQIGATEAIQGTFSSSTTGFTGTIGFPGAKSVNSSPSNTPPSNLNSAAPLTIAENQPIGTVVGEFNATDPDAGATLTYHFASGPGDTHNSLFTLETNGTLKTATTFDFESNASTYSIRVQVKDEHNGTAEGNFTVTLTDLNEPSQPNHFVDLNSSVNLEMIWVEPGTFTMGSPVSEANRQSDETQHNVTLTKGFYLGKYEVTQAQYEAVMTGNTNGLSPTPSQVFGNPNRPVFFVSWDDVQVFLSRLNAVEQAAGRLPVGWSYVLPTEAEWEYACRAGTNTATYTGTSYGIAAAQPYDVGQPIPPSGTPNPANPWGFFDMYGNVWEWVSDWYGAYPVGPVTDPVGLTSGSNRTMRGGSYNYNDARSAWRSFAYPSALWPEIGFRLAFKQITNPTANLNQAPTDLNSTAPLTFSENQPIGTLVGEFNATDADANATLTYYLVSGAGDGSNSLFTLEANGTLKTSTVFDYESNASSYSIRVQVKDEHNASMEENFTVILTDVSESPVDNNVTQPAVEQFIPIVETGYAKNILVTSATLQGTVVDDGGSTVTERGFLLSLNPNPKPGGPEVQHLDITDSSKAFETLAIALQPGKNYFYRAYATNAKGTGYGLDTGFGLQVNQESAEAKKGPWWIYAQPTVAKDWWRSHWFGNFYLNTNGWARHEKLGWVYPMKSPTAGLWLWKKDIGWLWTAEGIYPYLFDVPRGGWLYFFGQHEDALLVYDYSAKRWITMEDEQ